MTKKEKLLDILSRQTLDEIAIEVTVPDCPETETIINRKPNFEGKKKYYEKAYNDNLELISFPKIKIVSFSVKAGDQKPAYLCDPEKYTECDKTFCHTKGGDCFLTLDKKYTEGD